LTLEGGPQHALGPCDSPVRADTSAQKLEIGYQYYHMGHFSRYLAPGSTRVALSSASSLPDTLMTVAFVNVNQQAVVVVLNTDTANNVTIQLTDGGAWSRPITLPPNAIQTLVYEAW
jgi:glucosylceramidase